MNSPLRPGHRVVLKPSGLVGVVESVGDDQSFVFDHIERRERVYLADHERYRPLVSREEAFNLERELLTTAAIHELVGAPSATPTTDISRRLDLYLQGTQAQQMAAFATVLDWAVSAKAHGEQYGLWRGILRWGQDYLLGELASVLGLSPEAYEARLLTERAASRIRTAPVPSPIEPSPPLKTLGFYPDEGRHALGIINVANGLLVTQDIFETDDDSVDDGGWVQARSGRWHIYVQVVDDAKWLVLVHEDAIELALEPPVEADPWEDGQSGDGDSDIVVVRTKRGEPLVLNELVVCAVEGGVIGVFADGPSFDTSRVLRYHPPDGTALWSWGLAHALGGDGPVSVYGARTGLRDIIVIPAGYV